MKNSGRRSLHEDVVDAVIDEIGADGVVAIHHHRNLQLRSDAVRARNQHGFFHACEVAGKHSAEATDVGKHAGREGLARQIADAFLRGIGRVDIDAGVFISDGPILMIRIQAGFPEIQLPVSGSSRPASCRRSRCGYWPV